MYSPREVLKQEPAGIVTAASGINAAILGMGWYHLTDVQLGLWSTAAFGLLTLFYIRPATVTRAALTELDTAPPTVTAAVPQVKKAAPRRRKATP